MLFFQIRYFVFISFLPHDFIHEGCKVPVDGRANMLGELQCFSQLRN